MPGAQRREDRPGRKGQYIPSSTLKGPTMTTPRNCGIGTVQEVAAVARLVRERNPRVSVVLCPQN